MPNSIFAGKTAAMSPSSTRNKEGSLSFYFTLHSDHSCSASEHPYIVSKINSSHQSFLHLESNKTNHDHPCHESLSTSQRWKSLLFANDRCAAPLSRLSALFLRRKRNHCSRSLQACNQEALEETFSDPSSFIEWERPRASSWEQLSSWEKSLSSVWNLLSEEPHRASYAEGQEVLCAIAAHAAEVELDPLMKNEQRSKKAQFPWVKSLKRALKLRRRLGEKLAAQDGEDDARKKIAMPAKFQSARRSPYSPQCANRSGQKKAGLDRGFRRLRN